MEGRFRDLHWRMAVIALAVGMPMLAMFTDTACATSPNSVHACTTPRLWSNGSNLISTNRILALVTASQMACSLHAPTDQYRW
jgi:hypothetical protein